MPKTLILLFMDRIRSNSLFSSTAREYKVDGASKIKITDIPEGALVNVSVMLQSAEPKAVLERMEFKGSFEWQYRLVNPKKGK